MNVRTVFLSSRSKKQVLDMDSDAETSAPDYPERTQDLQSVAQLLAMNDDALVNYKTSQSGNVLRQLSEDEVMQV